MRSLIQPKVSDIPRLKEIWCEGFPEDAGGYCDFYFEKHFQPERCLAVYNGTEMESALHLFELYYIDSEGKHRDFLYPYAGATLKKYRGRGNLEYLLRGCLNYAAQGGAAGIVAAAADEIVYLYDRWKYQRTAPLHTCSLGAVPGETGLLWKACPFEKYRSLHEKYLNSIGNCFFWDEESEKYLYEDVFTRGGILFCQFDGREYFAVCTEEEDCLVIRETSFPLGYAELLADSIGRFFSRYGKVTVHTCEKDFFSRRAYSKQDIYNGHFGLVSAFPGSELMGKAYISLIGE